MCQVLSCTTPPTRNVGVCLLRRSRANPSAVAGPGLREARRSRTATSPNPVPVSLYPGPPVILGAGEFLAGCLRVVYLDAVGRCTACNCVLCASHPDRVEPNPDTGRSARKVVSRCRLVVRRWGTRSDILPPPRRRRRVNSSWHRQHAARCPAGFLARLVVTWKVQRPAIARCVSGDRLGAACLRALSTRSWWTHGGGLG